MSFCFPRGPLICLTAGKNVNRWLRFEFRSSHDIENRNNITLYRPWSWKTNLAEMVHEEKGWTLCSSENSSLLKLWLGSNLWPSIVEVEFPVGLSSCSFLPWVMFCSFPPFKPTTSKFQTGQKTVDLYQQMDLCLLTPFCTFVFLYFFEKKINLLLASLRTQTYFRLSPLSAETSDSRK